MQILMCQSPMCACVCEGGGGGDSNIKMPGRVCQLSEADPFLETPLVCMTYP